MKADGSDAVGKATAAVQKPQTLKYFLRKQKASIGQLLPKHIDPEQFLQIVHGSIYNNPTLGRCTFDSILIAARDAAQLGLIPNGVLGHAAMVPFRDKKKGTMEAKLIVMYQGLVQLAYNTGLYQSINVREVYEKDFFKYSYGTDEFIKHIPSDELDPGEITHFYSSWRLQNGGVGFMVKSKKFLLDWGKRYSPYYSTPGSPWQEYPDPMCMKSLLRMNMKLAPKSPNLATALDKGEAYERNVTPVDLTASIPDDEVPSIEEPKKPPKKKSGEVTGTPPKVEKPDPDTPKTDKSPAPDTKVEKPTPATPKPESVQEPPPKAEDEPPAQEELEIF